KNIQALNFARKIEDLQLGTFGDSGGGCGLLARRDNRFAIYIFGPCECHHCKSRRLVLASGSTTYFGRHLKGYTKRAIFQKQQQRITLQVVDPDSMSQVVTHALIDGRFDTMKMRESMAHWILMHKHPFTINEKEGFNMMQQRGML
nr:putative zinc finger, BED-type [Tanacetum cinerariifolium]